MTITTRLGRVRGAERPGATSFLGLPFARPPVGSLRWRPPSPPRAWSGVLDAAHHPNRSLQAPFPAELAPAGGIPGALSEDMLYLNVHTPRADAGGRPVVVYIHGGGFTLGSANDLDPAHYAARNNVVVVAMNYRLGFFGYLDLSRFGPEYEGSASLGFQDQIAALRWVQDNIADFGGDPGNVTLLGCSAGGGSVVALYAAPAAEGLFHRGVAMSPVEPLRRPPDAVGLLAKKARLSERELWSQLRDASAQAIFDLQRQAGLGSMACIDGHTLTTHPVSALAQRPDPRPLITGCTAQEGTMLLAGFQRAGGGSAKTVAAMEARMAEGAGAGDPARYIAFRDARLPQASGDARLTRGWFDVFRSYAVRAAEAATAGGGEGRLYTFALPTEHPFGPTHGSDVPFIFNSLDPAADGEMRVYYRNDARTRRWAEIWSNLFVTFASRGEPTGADLADWPTYGPPDRLVVVLDDMLRVVRNPDGDEALRAYGVADIADERARHTGGASHA